MSGIYIPGMEMPYDENDSIHILRDGTAVVYRTGSIDFYKAVPVPDHGRLKDTDVMCNECRRVAEECDGIYPDCTYCPVHSAPTIIPADPAKEGEG